MRESLALDTSHREKRGFLRTGGGGGGGLLLAQSSWGGTEEAAGPLATPGKGGDSLGNREPLRTYYSFTWDF